MREVGGITDRRGWIDSKVSGVGPRSAALAPGMYRVTFGTDVNDKEHYRKAIGLDGASPVFTIPVQ